MATIRSDLPLDDAATGIQTGTVGEPSVAASSKGFFVTGNWFATHSEDRGALAVPRPVHRVCPLTRGDSGAIR